jgi:hypothetical protein
MTIADHDNELINAVLEEQGGAFEMLIVFV